MFVSIGKAAALFGVSPSTLRRWDQAGKVIPAFRTVGGHRRYQVAMLLEYTNQLASKKDREKRKKTMPVPVVTYARVSSAKQRSDLNQQQRHLETYVAQKGWTLIKSYQDVGSGLNDKRRGLLQLLRDLPVLQPTRIVCSYEDRLARFGTRLLQTICELFSTKIVVTHQPTKQVTVNEQLVNDVIALLTSFAGKLHRARRGKQTTKDHPKTRRPISKGVS